MNWQDTRIETERLILRPPREEDFDAWADFFADERIARFLGGVQSRPEAWRGFLTMVGAWAIQGFGMFSVFEKVSGHWVGRIGPWHPVGWPGTEVGWGLVHAAWGRGYATEAATACIDHAFDVLGWSEVVHTIDPPNLASRKVAQGLGSRLRGECEMPAPYAGRRMQLWGQTREQWQARKDR